MTFLPCPRPLPMPLMTIAACAMWFRTELQRALSCLHQTATPGIQLACCGLESSCPSCASCLGGGSSWGLSFWISASFPWQEPCLLLELLGCSRARATEGAPKVHIRCQGHEGWESQPPTWTPKPHFHLNLHYTNEVPSSQVLWVKLQKEGKEIMQWSRRPGMVFQLWPVSSSTCCSWDISWTYGGVGWWVAYLRVGGTERKMFTLDQGTADGTARVANMFPPSESET